MVDLDEVAQQHAIVIGRDAMEITECEHALGKFGRRELSGTGEGRHGLVVEQAVGQPVQPWRLGPALFQIDLYQGNAL